MIILNKIVTVIIPSYNVEKILSETLDSLLDQECLPLEDIIVINDGSKDRTPEIAEQYVNKYPDSIRLINKENGGYGSALNSVFREARGKYLRVLDGDDWVNTQSWRILLERMKLLTVT